MKINKARMLFVTVLLLPSLCLCMEVQLRISAGLRRMKLDEVNLALAGWEERIKLQAASQPGWSFEGMTIPALHLGFGFDGELTLFLSRNLALGVNAGYVFTELRKTDTLLSIVKQDATYNYARPTKVSAYPVTFLGYLYIPLGSKAHIYFKGGGGLIKAKFVEREALKKATKIQFSYPVVNLAEAGSSTYLGGLGFDFKIDPSVGLFLEATAQSAKVSGFSSTDEAGNKSDLYSFEEYNPGLDFWEAKMQLFPQEPSGANYRSVQKATVDFSGFSLKMGVLIRF